mmetsp:Transcript_13442/g.34486  ORF Transcript_13442/g.34486 Transcript_13442/m.34486 type:complete len:244 (-) Transcript_13442:1325-2056(-)
MLPVARTMDTPRELSSRLGSTLVRKLGGSESSTISLPRKRLSMCDASGTSSARSSAPTSSLVSPIAICSGLMVSGYSDDSSTDTSSRSLCLPSSAIVIAFFTKMCIRPGSCSSCRLCCTSLASALCRYSFRMTATLLLKAGTCWLFPQLDTSLGARVPKATSCLSSQPAACPAAIRSDSVCRALGQSSSRSPRESMQRCRPFDSWVCESSPELESSFSRLRTAGTWPSFSRPIVTACFTSSCR